MTSASLTDRTLGAGGATRPAATAATPDSVSQADPGDSPDSLPGLWEAVLTALQRDPAISRANFATWLRNTQLLCGPVDETTQGSAGDGAASPKGGEAAEYVVGAQHTFARDKLERSFRPAVEQALARVSGRATVRVRFTVTSAAAQRDRDREHLTPVFDHPSPPVERGTYRSRGQHPLAIAVAPAEPPLHHVERGGAQRRGEALSLNPRYTFSKFVVGKSNQFAHAAARAVADNPALAYNPLYLYGDPGVGKTHLLHAIGHHVLALRLDTQVVCVSAHHLAGELADQVRLQQLETFRAKYRAVDVLLIDNVQSLAAVPGAGASGDAAPAASPLQSELYHLVTALHDDNKQVVLAGDQPPRAMIGLEERLRSWLQMGLVAGVAAPDFETRLAILRARAEAHRIVLPPTVLELVARRIQANVRELEGALTRVVAAAELSGLPPTVDHVATLLSDIAGATPQPSRTRATCEQVLLAVAATFRVPLEALKHRRRDKEIVVPRQVAMYLMREETGASLAEIGAELGGRDHSTVIHGWEKIGAALPSDHRLRGYVEAARQILVGGPGGPGGAGGSRNGVTPVAAALRPRA